MKYEAVMQEIRSKIEENKAILQKLLIKRFLING